MYDSISKSGLFNNGKNTAHPIYAVVEALSKNTSFYHTFKLLFTLCVNDLRLPITINQDEKISMKEKLKLNFNIHEVRFKNKPQEVKEFFDIFGLKSAIFEFIFYGKRDMIDQIYSPRVGMESKLTVKNEEKITIDDRKAEIKVQEQYDLFDEDQYTDFEAGGMEDYLASIPLDGQNYSSKNEMILSPRAELRQKIQPAIQQKTDKWRDSRIKKEKSNISISELREPEVKKLPLTRQRTQPVSNNSSGGESENYSINRYLEELNPISRSNSNEEPEESENYSSYQESMIEAENGMKKKKIDNMVKKEFQKLKEFTKKETMVSIIEEKEKARRKCLRKNSKGKCRKL